MQFLAEHAHEDVADAAGARGGEHVDRPGGVVLRRGRGRNGQRPSKKQEIDKSPHREPPSPVVFSRPRSSLDHSVGARTSCLMMPLHAEVPAPMRHGGAFDQLRRPEIADDQHRHCQKDRRRERHKAERLAKRRERKGDRKRQTAQRRGHKNAMRSALPERFAAADDEDDRICVAIDSRNQRSGIPPASAWNTNSRSAKVSTSNSDESGPITSVKRRSSRHVPDLRLRDRLRHRRVEGNADLERS